MKDHDLPEISEQEHLTIYKGLPTRRKLELYWDRHGFEGDVPKTIDYGKKFWTEQFITWHCRPVPEKVDMMRRLSDKYRVVVASNAISKSVAGMLELSELDAFVEFFLSNEDVERPKPDPQIYNKTFELLGLRPEDCLIVEDSEHGKAAAYASSAHVCPVTGPDEVNYYRVQAAIKRADRVNLVIPAAGQGKRFAEAGFIYPKPMIEVDGRPMLWHVISNIGYMGDPIVIAQKEHIRQYAMQDNFPGVDFVQVDGYTEGAAVTVLAAERYISDGHELVLANSDQLILPPPYGFLERMRQLDADGGIVTFSADDPKWSYVRIDEDGQVLEVAEKKVISNHATVGIYYFRRGSDFCWAAREMIRKDIRTNGEFYVAPVYNELVQAGKRIYKFDIEPARMRGLGTPEDLAVYVA